MTKVYVGMSGGVDSSLAASLLVEQGYNVTGVYMKNCTQDLPGMLCPWAEDLADAKRVAVQLGIDFKVFDFENQYREKVVEYMIKEYRLGRTPNPDIMCNQEIKFKLFLEASIDDGADLIATGHYARTENGLLKQAVDVNKDQTYFLYRINAKSLTKTLFPIGNFTKTIVREIARERKIYTAGKKDSQGICFVGKIGIRDFLSQYIEQKTGNIIDKQSGKVLGQHDGAIFYTIGQRHGLDIGGGLPYYVVSKDVSKNEIFVSTNLNDSKLWQNEININHIHWIKDKPQAGQYEIRVRHQAPLILADLTFNNTTVDLHLINQVKAISPGQSVVIYKDEICLGGGIVS